MQYRSDWPEVGLTCAITEQPRAVAAAPYGDRPDWTDEWRSGEIVLRWVATLDAFESELYHFAVRNFHLEVELPVSDCLIDAQLELLIRDAIPRLEAAPFGGRSYLFTRVVKAEALYKLLLESGFRQVEERRLYRTRIGDLLQGESPHPGSGSCFTSLAEVPLERYDSLRAQIFEICAETFRKRGFSRHFTDSFLLERLPGHAYIKAAMELNFRRQQAASFLIAVDRSRDLLHGFSVVDRKLGGNRDIYTQLLSAVRMGYRDRSIYQGISRLLVERLPPDAVLLNATHADNLPMQAAYQRSGRRHLADTAVMRRIFDSKHALTP